MITPSVKEIVADYLKAHGYEGLFNQNGRCSCELSNLFSCDCIGVEQCRAGFRTRCECGNHDFHISDVKPQTGEGE